MHREGFEIQVCTIPIHHYGPLSEVNNYQKMQAYYRMGKSKLFQLGDNPVALRELAIQAGILGKTAEAVESVGKIHCTETEYGGGICSSGDCLLPA